MSTQWVDILVSSTLLGIHVVTQSGNAVSVEKQSAVGEFYLTLWLQVASVLGSLLSAEDDASLVVRSRWVSMLIVTCCFLSDAAVVLVSLL